MKCMIIVNMIIMQIFLESYSRFSNNSEYLFYIGFIASMSEWYFDIEMEDVESMLKKATYLDPESLLYKWGYCCILNQRAEVNTETKYFLSRQILENDMLMKNIMSLLILMNCGMSLSLSIVNKIPLRN